MKLVEEREGEGRLTVHGEAVGPVGYAIHRYQGMTAGGESLVVSILEELGRLDTH